MQSFGQSIRKSQEREENPRVEKEGADTRSQRKGRLCGEDHLEESQFQWRESQPVINLQERPRESKCPNITLLPFPASYQ